MSKKHFIALADVIRNHNTFSENDNGKSPRGHIPGFSRIHLEILADWLEAENPRFKRERWLSYINGECGPNGGKVK